jgi:hypothetical protein
VAALAAHLSEYVNELINRAGVPAYKLAGEGVQGDKVASLTAHLSEYATERGSLPTSWRVQVSQESERPLTF